MHSSRSLRLVFRVNCLNVSRGGAPSPWHSRIGGSLAGSDPQTSSRTLQATIVYLMVCKQSLTIEEPNHCRVFGYMFGYRHQFGLFTFNFARSLICITWLVENLR